MVHCMNEDYVRIYQQPKMITHSHMMEIQIIQIRLCDLLFILHWIPIFMGKKVVAKTTFS